MTSQNHRRDLGVSRQFNSITWRHRAATAPPSALQISPSSSSSSSSPPAPWQECVVRVQTPEGPRPCPRSDLLTIKWRMESQFRAQTSSSLMTKSSWDERAWLLKVSHGWLRPRSRSPCNHNPKWPLRENGEHVKAQSNVWWINTNKCWGWKRNRCYKWSIK